MLGLWKQCPAVCSKQAVELCKIASEPFQFSWGFTMAHAICCVPFDHQNKGPKHPVYLCLYMLGMVAATCVISGEFWVTGQAFPIADGTSFSLVPSWFLHGCIARG